MATIEVPVNPSVLAWAITEGGYSPAQLADELREEQSVVRAWLSGKQRPGLTQFRKVATLLRRPTAVFLLPEPPKTTAAGKVEFRHPPGREDRPFTPKERLRLREALRLQRGLKWISAELQDVKVRLPSFNVSTDPEGAARDIRETLKITPATQRAWKSDSAAFRAWRELFERTGIVVLALPMGSEAARGFSVWDDFVPVIAINTHWNPSARTFTLFHELGHLVTRTSSMCEETVGDKTRAPVTRSSAGVKPLRRPRSSPGTTRRPTSSSVTTGPRARR